MSRNESDPPSAGDDAFKQRIKGVLAELENESFKNEVLSQLKEASKKKKTGLFQHPAFLLFLGFLLTGGVGTWLTSFWQTRAKQKEQDKLAHERALQQKFDITDQINKAVAEAYAGTQVMFGVLSSEQVTKNAKEVAERETYWKQTARNWVINSLVLQQKLAINFKGRQASDLYQEIVDGVEETNISIREAHEDMRKAKRKTLTEEEVRPLIEMADKTREKTRELLVMLVEEIHAEERSAGGPRNCFLCL